MAQHGTAEETGHGGDLFPDFFQGQSADKRRFGPYARIGSGIAWGSRNGQVGPCELELHDTTYSSVIIRLEDGPIREFAPVDDAIYEVSGPVEPKGGGTFAFRQSEDECRLAFVYRDTGARAADFEALHLHFEGVQSA